MSKSLGYPIGPLVDMPVLFQHLEPVMYAFNMLSSCRQMGAFGGVGPIPLSDIITYLKWEEVGNHEDEKNWIRFIRSMDNAYITHQNESMKEK